VAAPDWLLDLERMECAVMKRGRYSEYFTDEDIERIRAFKLDFLVKFGFGITRGAILDVARYGVWSFHHDDEARYRGSPALLLGDLPRRSGYWFHPAAVD